MTDDAMLAKTKQILLTGGDGTCARGGSSGNGTVPVTSPTSPESSPTKVPGTAPSTTAPVSQPTSTGKCDWGCLGWDCSATVPCQKGLKCKSGYCKK
jgi:hypothetical protein